jgi:hypothetical protein
LSEVNHPVKLIIDSFDSAKMKEVADQDENAATEPESDYRLVKLIGVFLRKLLNLLNVFIEEIVKEIAKKFVNGVSKILFWFLLLLIVLLIYRYQ